VIPGITLMIRTEDLFPWVTLLEQLNLLFGPSQGSPGLIIEKFDLLNSSVFVINLLRFSSSQKSFERY